MSNEESTYSDKEPTSNDESVSVSEDECISTSSGEFDETSELSLYEKERLKRIARNKRKLEELFGTQQADHGKNKKARKLKDKRIFNDAYDNSDVRKHFILYI